MLEKECLDTAWSEQSISRFLDSDTAVYLYCDTDGVLSGILSATVVCGEAEIENIAVKSEYRRRGIGTALLSALKERCEKVFLLVKADNYGAIDFYTCCGFFKAGVRKGFYSGTDAYIMELKVK